MFSALELNGQSGARRKGHIQAREQQEWIRTVASRTSAKIEANIGQIKPTTWKRHDRASETRIGKCQAREGHDSIMPKKDMIEIDNLGKVSI